MWNPWRALRALDHIEVIWQHLPADLLAMTDGQTLILIDPRQRQFRRRCTIAHELAHIALGHKGRCTPRDERAADEWAARKLIKLHHLVDAMRWAQSFEELAYELWVDHATLRARLDTLTPDEIKHLDETLDKDKPC